MVVAGWRPIFSPHPGSEHDSDLRSAPVQALLFNFWGLVAGQRSWLVSEVNLVWEAESNRLAI